jgi:O-antigen biosynthesis protein
VSLDARPFDVVYFHRYGTAAAMAAEARRLMPQAHLILNVADLHHLRLRRGADLSGASADLAAAEAVEAVELAAIRAVDTVIVHAAYEERILRERHRIARVATVPWSLAAGQPATNWPARRDIAFIGGFLHQPNRDAADLLVRDILPRVREAVPGTRCILIGSDIPAGAYDGNPALVVAGHVASIPQALESVRLTVAPLRYGAGIKGKVLTSLSAGVPCVMSPVAREGLALTGDLRDLAVDAIPDMADRIIALLQAPDERLDALGRLGLRYIAQHHQAKDVDMALEKILAEGKAANGPGAGATLASPAEPKARRSRSRTRATA